MGNGEAILSAENYRVYDDYEFDSPPGHPGPSWTRIVCISDTHSRTYRMPSGDVLIHAGDLSSWGYPEQLKKTLDWLAGLEFGLKIIVAGNHDLALDPTLPDTENVLPQGDPTLEATRQLMRSQELLDKGIYYLENEPFEFASQSGRTYSVYGTPASPKHANGAFQYTTREEATEIFSKIPENTEILITHTPPKYICDLTRKGKNAGCRGLAHRVKRLPSCKLHVFGHIHEAHGVAKLEDQETIFVNAAMTHRSTCPIIVDLHD